MATEREDVALYGGKAEVFRTLRGELEDRLGYRPTKPETVGHLIEHYDGPLLDDGRRQ
jgi:hypothetical protein